MVSVWITYMLYARIRWIIFNMSKKNNLATVYNNVHRHMAAYLERTQRMPSVPLTYICVCKRRIIRWHTLMPYAVVWVCDCTFKIRMSECALIVFIYGYTFYYIHFWRMKVRCSVHLNITRCVFISCICNFRFLYRQECSISGVLRLRTDHWRNFQSSGWSHLGTCLGWPDRPSRHLSPIDTNVRQLSFAQIFLVYYVPVHIQAILHETSLQQQEHNYYYVDYVHEIIYK